MNFLQIFTFASAEFFATFLFAQKFVPERDVYFLLRVRRKSVINEKVIQLETKDGIKQSAFDPKKPTSFLVHGYTEDQNVDYYTKISNVMLSSRDQNLFFVDWGRGSKNLIYAIPRARVPEVAKVLGAFINFLQSSAGLDLNQVTLIGLSLGAHVVGLAGKNFINGRVNRLVGLDPALPLFDVNDPKSRLSPESAKYTECVHTGFFFGFREPICQTDFYVNGGQRQPGCVVAGIDLVPCSHGRSADIFAEAYTNPKAFYGFRCNSLKNALNSNCNGEPGAFFNDDENLKKNISGIFHVTTNKKPPYGRGQ